MTMLYDNTRWADAVRISEGRAAGGRIGAARTREIRLAKRRQGVTMHVTRTFMNDEDAPAIRLNGRWLSRLGFNPGDKVILTATEGRITITREE